MKLSALIDFADDASEVFFESTMQKMLARLKKAGVTRIYYQYSGNRDYGYLWEHNAPIGRGVIETMKNMPQPSKTFVDISKAYGIEPVVIMRPLEQGQWFTFSPYYKEADGSEGVPYIGGKVLLASNFLLQNPDLRVKRRNWDIDPEAGNRNISTIKLKKSNNIHSRIRKEDLNIYVSDNNCNYVKYSDDFNIEYLHEKQDEDVVVSALEKDYPTRIITKSGDDVEILKIGGLNIKERYIAIEARCDGVASEEQLFFNVPVKAISIYDKRGNQICSTPGSAIRNTPTGESHLRAGFNFDDGFGECWGVTLDPNGNFGYLAICKGKYEYAHGTLCACEPEVQKYWLKWLDKALEDGYEMVGNRIECHSMHVDEPFAYGYNDCIKKEYYKRHGYCSEQEMDLKNISKIRGDAYTEFLIESAKRVRAKRKKFVVTLNLEMLYDPIPIARRMAYPMNVEWQWERWLEEIKPDEINIRTFNFSPEFILKDIQCMNIINTAKQYDVPLTLERYCYWDFAEEFEMVRDTGIFERMTLYETYNVIKSDGKGGIIEEKPELLKQLEVLTNIIE